MAYSRANFTFTRYSSHITSVGKITEGIKLVLVKAYELVHVIVFQFWHLSPFLRISTLHVFCLQGLLAGSAHSVLRAIPLRVETKYDEP